MQEIEHIKQILLQHGYEYKDFLGKGGFSNVLLCQSQKYNQNFAIKRSIKHRLTEDEYNHLITLNHPNIIRLYDAFNDEKAQYLVMEYCQNGTINQKGNLPYDKFVYYAKQMLEAIAFCHSNNIAHRDIKPENIFLDQYDHIKLADFGMAKYFDFDSKSSEKCGSLMYLAPEMLHFQKVCPFKADIWALGITFFYMATGAYPFPHSTKEELKNLIYIGEIDFDKYEINPKIRFLLNRMAIKDQNLRPSARKLLELPMFSSSNLPLLSSKSNSRINLSSFRTHSSVALNNPIIVSNSPNSDEKRDPKPIPHENIRTYRSVNVYHKFNRINARSQQIRKIDTF